MLKGTMGCSCGLTVLPIEADYCEACGDVKCDDCSIDCVYCKKTVCSNCAEDANVCIMCYMRNPVKETAYLMVDGRKLPIKDPNYIIEQTSTIYGRNIRLELDGESYQFDYRTSAVRADAENQVDYFIYFITDYEVAQRGYDSLWGNLDL